MKHLLLSIFAATTLLASPLTFSPAQAQQMPGIEQVDHVALNEKLARQAIDATLFIRKNYSDHRFSEADPTTMISAMKEQGVYKKMTVELRKFGFNSPESWSKAAMSTAVAVGFTKNGDGADMMAQMEAMQASSGMSEEMKAQMMATINAIMPPKQNIKIARIILRDRKYAAKVKQLFDR